MEEFFASIYEWFGFEPFYKTDLGDLLRGWDITCSGHIDTKWYILIGWSMIGLTSLLYAFQYHIYDSSKFNKKQHWWIMAFLIITLNFLIAFLIPYNIVKSGDFCSQLNLSVTDCIGFGLSNGIWSFIFFLTISTIPLIRRFSTNCRNTTFWKP